MNKTRETPTAKVQPSWLFALLVTLGCSSSGELTTAPVSGKVTYNGKPVPNGTVMFVPDQGPPATGEIAKDGSYRLSTYTDGGGDGAVLGNHKISITALQDTSGALPEQRSGTPKAIVPRKYLSHETSGLTAEVRAGDNTIDLPLTDE
jgi:hypothetical protein